MKPHRRTIVLSHLTLVNARQRVLTYKSNVDDLFAWALVFAPVVIGYGGGWLCLRWWKK
jgi:hypothetical protein